MTKAQWKAASDAAAARAAELTRAKEAEEKAKAQWKIASDAAAAKAKAAADTASAARAEEEKMRSAWQIAINEAAAKADAAAQAKAALDAAYLAKTKAEQAAEGATQAAIAAGIARREAAEASRLAEEQRAKIVGRAKVKMDDARTKISLAMNIKESGMDSDAWIDREMVELQSYCQEMEQKLKLDQRPSFKVAKAE
jgi:hypothetical protein